jgi:hypothetical protein
MRHFAALRGQPGVQVAVPNTITQICVMFRSLSASNYRSHKPVRPQLNALCTLITTISSSRLYEILVQVAPDQGSNAEYPSLVKLEPLLIVLQIASLGRAKQYNFARVRSNTRGPKFRSLTPQIITISCLIIAARIIGSIPLAPASILIPNTKYLHSPVRYYR